MQGCFIYTSRPTMNGNMSWSMQAVSNQHELLPVPDSGPALVADVDSNAI